MTSTAAAIIEFISKYHKSKHLAGSKLFQSGFDDFTSTIFGERGKNRQILRHQRSQLLDD
jgi:hypothetical protein